MKNLSKQRLRNHQFWEHSPWSLLTTTTMMMMLHWLNCFEKLKVLTNQILLDLDEKNLSWFVLSAHFDYFHLEQFWHLIKQAFFGFSNDISSRLENELVITGNTRKRNMLGWTKMHLPFVWDILFFWNWNFLQNCWQTQTLKFCGYVDPAIWFTMCSIKKWHIVSFVNVGNTVYMVYTFVISNMNINQYSIEVQKLLFVCLF